MKLFSVVYKSSDGYRCFQECESWNDCVELAEFLLKHDIAESVNVMFQDKYGHKYGKNFKKGDCFLNAYQ